MIKTHLLSSIRYFFVCLLLLVIASTTAASVHGFETAVDPITGAAYAKGEFIIKYKDWDKRKPTMLAKTLDQPNEIKAENIKARTVLVKVDERNVVSFRANAQKLDENIAYIEPNYVVTGAAVPLDSLYAADQTVMWDGVTRYEPLISANVQEDMRIDAAWDTTKGSNAVKIAVLDTGINSSHQDLSGKVVAAYNHYSPGQSPEDDNGHGSLVASIIAANTNFNSATTGMAGTCPECVLLNGKVLNSNNVGTISSVANGLYWAKDQGANIINVSIYLGATNSLTIYDALSYVKSGGNNVTVVVAAGNLPLDAAYPGLYPSTLAVGWLNADGGRNTLSAYGNWVDVMAYGTNILGAVHSGTTSYTTAQSGSSFAAPFVAGTAGLLYSRGDLPATDRANYVRRTISESARVSSATSLSNRVLDAQAAVTHSWVAETATTSAVRLYVYQDNNNNSSINIGDVCLKTVPLSMKQYVGGSWSYTAPLSYPGGAPEVLTNTTQVENCKNGVETTLIIDRPYQAIDDFTDNPTTGTTEFIPDYYVLQAGVRREKYGDCNGDGKIDAGDLTATSLEIFDGDGSFWLDTLGGSSSFTRFCDSNRDTVVNAADISCTANRIFDPNFVCG